MTGTKRNIAVIGATGSVGGAVLEACLMHYDIFNVWALAARKNVEGILSLGNKFGSDLLVLSDEMAAMELQNRGSGSFECRGGAGAVESIIEDPRCEEVVFASSGTDALPVLVMALKAGKKIFLANKEIIVAAGEWVMPHVGAGAVIPLDSEHNAVWQSLRGEDRESVRKIFLTASGGPFLDLPDEELSGVTFEMAVRHPVWPMGSKISVDSATLMNKGIEIIEARQLFSLPPEKIDAVIHPGSQVHALVEFVDGSIKMLLSRPDMRLAALAALGYPGRLENTDVNLSPPEPKDLFLEFREPDEKKFPRLKIAKEVCRQGGAYPPLLIGADEAAVDLFMKGRIGFTDIPFMIREVLESFSGAAPGSWEEALYLVDFGRQSVFEKVSFTTRNTGRGK
jgi:1-deoxy-D-xylulose-5-phosphate reductoisomerase